MTPFEKRCELLSAMLTLAYNDERYADFIRNYDLYIYGAVLYNSQLAVPNPKLEKMIDYTFDKWLEMVGVDDTGYENIYHIDIDLSLPSVLGGLEDE